MRKSIKNRVIVRVSGLIAVAMLFITLMVSLIVYKNMSDQMHILLENDAYATQQRMEQRIRYLVENSVLLTKNDFIINSLIDAQGRDRYLPPLVKNFMEGKDVIFLSVLDFDGKEIFVTQEDIPSYKSSSELRTSLAMGEVVVYLQNNNMVLVAPIQYYSTTQGSIVVVFDLSAIAKRNLPNDKNIYMELIKNNNSIFIDNFIYDETYHSYMLEPISETPYLEQLGVMLNFGVVEDVYHAPVKDAIISLIAIGILFVLAGIFLSVLLANTITKPILELYRRVKVSDGAKSVLCSPIGTNDELETLAEAFDERSQKLQHLAKHDALTDLPNRMLFLDRLEQAIKLANRENSMIAVLFIDLDHFKEVNDSFGHSVGDELLKKIALDLHSIMRDSDTVARMGGDEFTILIEHIHNEYLIVDVIQKVMQQFENVQVIGDHQFYISCSIGVAVYPLNGTTPEVLLKNSDAAMYKAKSDGRKTYQFYTDNMTEKAYQRVMMETQLRQAISENEFQVYYQPQVDMRNKNIVGMEALIRWIHPRIGMIAPNEFIPLAEDSGLIIEIDKWVMSTAMKQYAQWINEGLQPGVLSLNLSLIQLKRSDFIEMLSEMILESGLSKKYLKLEVTETQAMKDPEKTIEILENLKGLGIGIAVDDFGTGQSSLSYLKRLPVDKIKIDQSFVSDIPHDKDDLVLTRTIIAMANNLNLGVIAEGVETQEQADFLLKHKCFEAQGFLYYRPMPANEIEKVLKSKQ